MPDITLEESLAQIGEAVRRNSSALGAWDLQAYRKFLARLPERIKNLLEVEDSGKRLVVSDFYYAVPEDLTDPHRVTDIKERGKDLTVPLKARFALIKDGKVIARSKPRLVAQIPFPTDVGTFVLGGQEFNVSKQLRLAPGVYVTKRKDGRIKAQVNTSTRQNMDVYFAPDKHKFTFRIGGKAFPLYPVLSALGVTEEQMRDAWGHTIYARNKKSGKAVNDTIAKLYGVMYRFDKLPESHAERVRKIRQAFSETEVDPWVTGVTLGKKYPVASGDMLLRATRKALGVSRSKVEEDDMEALYFKEPYNIGRMVEYALERASGRIRNKVKQRLRNTNDLDSIVSRPLSALSSTIKRKYNEDELARTPDQHNPLGMYHDNTEITFLGEGGISDRQMISEKARGIHDSMIGFIDPLHSPEGGNVGMTIHLADRATFEPDGIFQMMLDRSGNEHKVGPRDIYDKIVALPAQVKMDHRGKPILRPGNKVDALYKGKVIQAPAHKVDYIMHGTPNDAFSGAAHIPFVNADMGIRAGVGVKQMGQALPLKYREAPLVRALSSSGESTGHIFYRRMNVTAPSDMPEAVVTKVTDKYIYLRDAEGRSRKIPMKKHYQINGDASITDTPIVKPGDKVTGGQVLAENQFSKDGETALGANLDVAFVPFYGLNHQDGLVISQKAAEKLTSLHSYEHEVSRDPRDVFSKKKFLAHYPTLYKKKSLEKMDDEGVILPGSVIQPGEPLVLKMTPQKLNEDDLLMGNINKVFSKPLRRDDKVWQGAHPAVVRKVVKTKRGIRIYVNTEEPAHIGDKITNKHGAKGVITAILPDDEMPRYEDGTVPDILQNPAAVISRMNAGQIYESMAARIAKARGKAYKVHNMLDRVNAETLAREMLDAGLATRDAKGEIDVRRTLTLPNGKTVRVFAGPQYVTKLKQQSESYFSARGRKDRYDIVGRRPVQGPKMGPLGWYGMLAHGATENLKEISGWKGEKNDDLWRLYETGQALPSPKTTFALDRLFGILNAAGINVRESGGDYHLLPLTDEDVSSVTNGEVPRPALSVRIGKSGASETLESEKGGLYDQKVFGGMQGDKYGHITLAAKLPNPVFETPVKKILGISGDDYNALIRGDKGVLNGRIVDVASAEPAERRRMAMRGAAFEELLGRIDVDAQIKDLKTRYKSARGQHRNDIATKLRYLSGLRRAGKKPTDYLISRLAVIPPKFRPIYLRSDGSLGVSDLTLLYQRVGLFNDALRDVAGLPSSVVNSNFQQLYDAVKELQTTGRTEGKRQTLGALAFLKGKSGHFMSKIMAKREALGGRATIMPDPKLDIDEIRIPEEMAWKIFEPKLMRRMSLSGIQPLEAQQMIEDRTEMASKMLDAEMEHTPVIIRRDPKLHKFNMLAFRARRTPGHAIYIPPLVTKGFNADFDGDAMSVTVPIGEKAVKEAWDKLRPSSNLIKPGQDRPIIQPTEESIAGLYAGTRIKRDTRLKFEKDSDVLKALREGKLSPTDGIRLRGTLTSPGRVLAMQKVPESFRDYSTVLSARKVEEILKRIAEEDPKSYGKAVRGLKDAGDTIATEIGFSFRARDFVPVRDKSEIKSLKPGASLTKAQQASIKRKLRKHLGEDSALAIMADSGAKGSWENIKQMLYSPVTVRDATGRQVDHIIRRGFADGLTFTDYWHAAKGARKGLIDKGVETARPGFFGKEILRSVLDGVVQRGDTQKPEGVEYDVSHPTVLNRYLAADVAGGDGTVLAKAGDPVTPELVQAAKRLRIKRFLVRSPLTTRASSGFYAKDFGRLPGNGRLRPGTNVGIISAHTLTEPATQLTLKKFHSGGSGDVASVAGLDTAWAILKGKAPEGTRAPLAPRDAKVVSISTLPSGASVIMLDTGEKITADPGRKLMVRRGDSVRKGQQLQEGNPDPIEVLKYRGYRPMQMYMVEQVEKAYGKHAPDRRYIETIVAGLTRYARVKDPGDSDYVPGEVVPINKLRDHNARLSQRGAAPVAYEPHFLGIGPSGVKAKNDWVSAMLHGDQTRRLPDLAAAGAVSSTHSADPTMPYLHSTEFGDKLEEGMY